MIVNLGILTHISVDFRSVIFLIGARSKNNIINYNMATLVSEEYEPVPVKEMPYDEFCIAAFGKDVEELRTEKQKH